VRPVAIVNHLIPGRKAAEAAGSSQQVEEKHLMVNNQTIGALNGGVADAKTDIKRRAKRVGRWIGFLPAAALSAMIAQLVFALVSWITLIFIGMDPDELIIHGYLLALSGGMMGAAFVYVGARIAPKSPRVVALSLAGLTLFLVGVITMASLFMHNHWALWQGIFCAFGASATAWCILQKKLN
jgi:hypothetical protein